MSNTIEWEYSSNLSLMSISSYVEYKTGNMNDKNVDICIKISLKMFLVIYENMRLCLYVCQELGS